MLGEQIGELTGQITGTRVLPDEGHGAKVEVSFQQTGTLLGVHINDMGTYISVTRPTRAVAAAATERGDQRYEHRSLLTAATIDARAGQQADPDALATLVERFIPFSGTDGWRDLAALAEAARSQEIWRLAEQRAALILAEASGRTGIDAERAGRAVRVQLDRLRP